MAPRSVSPGRSITPLRSRSPIRRDSRAARYSRTPSRSLTPPPPRRPNGYGQRSYERGYSRSRSPVRSISRSISRSPARSPGRAGSKLVVEKLTKNINEDHLYEIFGAYGHVRKVDLPINPQFHTNRGTAFVLYEDHEEAEAAIQHMDEAQIDGAVIHVSLVLARHKLSPSPPPLPPARRPPAQLDRYNGRASQYPRGPPPRPPPRRDLSPRARGFSPPPRRAYSPAPSARAGPGGRESLDTYRPGARSRSRSPPRRGYSPPTRRRRSYSRDRSYSRSLSRSPPPRRGTYARDDSPPPPLRRGAQRRRSPSYDSYIERSLSRDRRRRRY